MQQVSYLAYIDESGDDGLSKVSPIDDRGASEWFTLAACVVRADSNREAVWVRNILERLNSPQRSEIHFQPLKRHKQVTVCDALARLPIRCFAVISNKKNMRAYQNKRAERVSHSAGRTWFYWWMTRLLLERITDYCERRSMFEYEEPRLVRLIFARRGGLRYSHCQSYLYWLCRQSQNNSLYLNQGDLKWSTIDPLEEIRVHSPSAAHGLQLADCVAGAFYQAVNGNPEPALALAPRMAFNGNGSIMGYGIKLMPSGYLANAPHNQREIFDFYAKEGGRSPSPF